MSNDKIELPVLKGSDREKVIPLSIVVGTIVLLFILLITFFSLTFKKTYTLHYSENSDINYKVYLKDNEFFTEEYLDMDKQYISTIVDYIDADFDYSFTSGEDIGMQYSYYVTATIDISNADGKSLYQKEHTIVDKKKFAELSGNKFSVNENVKIDYGYYNQIAKNFINQYEISANANLIVSLFVDVTGKHADFDKKISNKEVVTLNIPLSSKTVDITMDYELSNNTDEVLQYRSTIISNPTLFTISIFLMLIDICVIICVVIWVIKNRDNETLYTKKLDRILKDYERYICETAITQRVEDMMKTRSLRIEIVKSFEDLIDVRDNLGKPILFHEERPGEEAIFYILSDKVGYIYLMRLEDMKKEKKKR